MAQRGSKLTLSRSDCDDRARADHAATARGAAWVLALIVAALVAIAFLPALNNQFLLWDDDINFNNNPHYRGLDLENLQWMFTSFHSGHYQPVAWLTLGWDAAWGDKIFGEDATWGPGMNPRAYHLTSILFHAANAALVYLLALRLISLAWTGNKVRRASMIHVCAAAAALLWGAHPMRVENVAWITERRDLVSAFFLLLTLQAYLCAARSEHAIRWRWIAISAALYVVSLMAKVSGVPLVAALIAIDWYPLRRFAPAATHIRRSIWLEKFVFASIALLFAFVAVKGQSQNAWLYPLEGHPLSARIVQMAYGLVFYLYKTAWPVDLLPLYALRRPMDVSETRFVIAMIIALGVIIVVIALFLLRRGRPVIVALLCYAGFLGPVLGLFQNGPQIVADRYTYLPAIGLMILLAGACGWWLQHRRSKSLMIATAVVAVVIVGTLMSLTWSQTRVWRDSESLWSFTLRKDPTCAVASDWLGVLRARDAKYAEAIPYFRRAVENDPNSKIYREHLRNALRETGQTQELIAAWVDEARFGQYTAEFHYTQGVKALRASDLPAAVEHLSVSAALRPNHAPAQHDLGVALERQGNELAAIERYRAALRVDPNFIESRYGLAAALARIGRFDEALTETHSLLNSAPNHAQGRQLLNILQSRKK